jgi:hypothetical protein
MIGAVLAHDRIAGAGGRVEVTVGTRLDRTIAIEHINQLALG